MIHILLAAYNEEKSLGAVLEDIARALADGNFRVWVVDDGSTDETFRIARTWSTHTPLTLVRHPRNQGLGKALQTGFTEVRPVLDDHDVLVTLDADHTHPPQLIPRLVQPLEENEADLSIASRFVPGGRTVGVPWFRRLTSWGARCVFGLAFSIPGVSDYTCGFRAYRGDLLHRAWKRWDSLITENGFAASLESLVRLSVLKPRIREIPLVLRYDRKPTKSRMPVLQTVVRSLRLISRLKMIP